MNIRGFLFLIVAAACAVSGGAAYAAPSLTVGDTAPTLQVARWVKGEPVTAFQKGRVYVVQFWATWCGPCVAEAPHLSKLAHQYRGKVTFIGVHSEAGESKPANDAYWRYIRKFVEKRGERMDYAVAVDDPKKHATYNAWVTAAGGWGPSCHFIIDREGKIAWINGPSKIDVALAQVLDGSIDLPATKAHHLESAARSQRTRLNQEIVTGPAKRAYDRGDFAVAVVEANEGLAAHPDKDSVFVVLSSYKLRALLHINEEEGLGYARSLLADERFVRAISSPNFGAEGAQARIGGSINSELGLSTKAYLFAVECLTAAVKEQPGHYGRWAALARAQELRGALDLAIEARKRSIALAEKADEKHGDPDIPDEEFINAMKDDLKRLEDERAARKS